MTRPKKKAKNYDGDKMLSGCQQYCNKKWYVMCYKKQGHCSPQTLQCTES